MSVSWEDRMGDSILSASINIITALVSVEIANWFPDDAINNTTDFLDIFDVQDTSYVEAAHKYLGVRPIYGLSSETKVQH